MEHYSEMLAAARNFGLDIKSLAYSPDWKRVKTFSKPKNRNGAYYIFPNKKVMVLWDWERGLKETWKPSGKTSRGQHRAELSKILRQEKAIRIVKQKKAVEECCSIWRKSSPIKKHAYTTNKCIKPYAARTDASGNLIIPICSLDNKLQSLQFISSNGKKRFKSGANLKGNASLIGDFENYKSLLICEGYATGCSLHEATGRPVLVAFNAGNLASVVDSLMLSNSSMVLYICADNDHHNERENGINTGLNKARRVAEKHNIPMIWPQFRAFEAGSDFNDVHCQYGLSELTTLLNASLKGVL